MVAYAEEHKGAGSTPTSVTEHKGLTFERHFTKEGIHPFDEIEWEIRTAKIEGESGTVFEQEGVEVPKFWSQLATNVVSSKYFRGQLGTPERESSVKQLISRVVNTIVKWGKEGKYFTTEKDAQVFGEELIWLTVNQTMAWNSPVWFNIGVPNTPQQSSACFLLDVKDNMDSILNWYTEEGKVFLGGSGSGVNLSKIRGAGEPLSGGGTASGPLSFARAADASSSVIKSGGKTRRSAKLICLNVDHPDIEEFVWCKVKEEKKARILIEAGYNGAIDGEAYSSVDYQNANNSVQVTDQFMRAARDDQDWELRYIKSGKIKKTIKAKDLLRQIAQAAFAVGDPGIQFYTTINDWHTLPNTANITTSNPCGEYLSVSDSACNLASLNLIKFLKKDSDFDVDAFKKAVDITVTSQEILVSQSDFPTKKITENARAFRQLGLGYSNLGALLMTLGLPYDSHEGRNVAASITALMTGEAYLQSSKIAAIHGPFWGFQKNAVPMLLVMEKHQRAVSNIDSISNIKYEAERVWGQTINSGIKYGYRNAQATVIPPTGTVSFFMDCDTTGGEPAISLVAYKKLVGGGTLKIVNTSVGQALYNLGYSTAKINNILEHILEYGTIENCQELLPKDLPIFDCAFVAGNGNRSIHYMGHIKMIAAIQPFLSGTASKTANLPNSATVEDIMDLYVQAWEMGLKSVTVYRDGCKANQPLNTKKADASQQVTPAMIAAPQRKRLPNDRKALTHKFDIAGHEGYIHTGLYADGTPGEVFIRMAKEGSTVSGLMDTVATLTSLALQYGVPLDTLVNKFSHVRYEPSGFTQNKEIPYAKSLTDYLFRYLERKFLSTDKDNEKKEEFAPIQSVEVQTEKHDNSDAPLCVSCGALMRRKAGSCWLCGECGSTSGGCS